MTESMTTLAAVYTVAPASLERARRLQFAVALLRGGTLRRQASGMVRRHFSCSHSTAWRLVDMAADLALIEPAAGADAAPRASGHARRAVLYSHQGEEATLYPTRQRVPPWGA